MHFELVYIYHILYIRGPRTPWYSRGSGDSALPVQMLSHDHVRTTTVREIILTDFLRRDEDKIWMTCGLTGPMDMENKWRVDQLFVSGQPASPDVTRPPSVSHLQIECSRCGRLRKPPVAILGRRDLPIPHSDLVISSAYIYIRCRHATMLMCWNK